MSFNVRHGRGLRRDVDARVNENESRDWRAREDLRPFRLRPTRDVKTSDYTAATWESVLVDPSGGEVTVTLPTLGLQEHGAEIEVMNVVDDATEVTVASQDGATINGSDSETSRYPYGARTFRWDAPRKVWRSNGRYWPMSEVRGGQPLYQDYLFSGLAIARGSNAPTLTLFRGSLYLYAFAGTGVTVNQGFFAIHILHEIDADGDPPTMHVHWSHNNAAPSGDVKWYIDYSVAKGYEQEAFPATTTLSATQTAAAQYYHHIAGDDAGMQLAAVPEVDSVILGRIYRDPADAADTFADNAFLVNIDMHFQMAQIGTIEKNSPFTDEGF